MIKKTPQSILLTLVLILASSTICFAQRNYKATWKSIDSRPIAPWFQDAKLGIFVTWGLFSVPAWSPKGTYAEWYQYWLQEKNLFGNGNFTGNEIYDHHTKTYGKDFSYYNFGDMFKAQEFHADDWAKLFERAGAKYMVITTKHHDGFCLWPSKTANKNWGRNWNAKDCGSKRDLLKELEIAVKKTSVKFGTYYSLYEWYNPLWQTDKEKFVKDHLFPQFKELVEGYKPDLIWPDGDWEISGKEWHSPELLQWLFNKSAVGDSVVINDRWGKGIRFHHGGYYSPEYQSEIEVNRPWEECRGIGFSFGYNKNERAEDYATPQTLIYLLTNVVSNGGNLLLDIGPDANGLIPPIMEERLLALGKWLDINGEAIYGTRKWTRPCQWSLNGKTNWKPKGAHYMPADFILKQTVQQQPGYAVREAFFTKKGSTLFVISPRWKQEGLVIRDLNITKENKITMLGTDRTVGYKNEGRNVRIFFPSIEPDQLPGQYAWSFKIENIVK